MLRNVETTIDPLFGEAPQKEISLLGIVVVLARHRKRILTFALCAFVLGLLVSMILPNRYTAMTSILPPQQSSSTSSAIMAQLGSLGSLASATGAPGLKNPNDLQVAMMRSQTVEDAIIDRFHLSMLYHTKRLSQTRKKLEQAIDIESGAKDGLIRVSVTDGDANRAAEMANGYIDEFKKFSATLAVTEASQRRVFFEQQLEQAKNDLAKAEDDLKDTEQQTGVIQLDGQAQAAIQSVAQLRAQIVAKEVHIRAMRSFATDANPDLQMAQQELDGLRAEQEKLGSSGSGVDGGLLIPKGVMQDASLKYVRKLRDVKYYQSIFALLARQYEQAKVDEAKQGAFVQIVDHATIPDHKSSPKVLLILAGATVLGLVLGVAWAFSVEALARISRNPDERTHLATLRELLAKEKPQSTYR